VTAAAAVLVLTVAGERTDSAPARAPRDRRRAALLAASAARSSPPGRCVGRGIPARPGPQPHRRGVQRGRRVPPLLLTVLHGFPPSLAGVSLTITGVTWAAGSWAQGRDHTVPRVLVLRAGLALMSTGSRSPRAGRPGLTPCGLAGECVAGLGMGLASPRSRYSPSTCPPPTSRAGTATPTADGRLHEHGADARGGWTLLALSRPIRDRSRSLDPARGFLAAVTGPAGGRVTPRAAVTSGG
jgi:hypothetical protein